MKKEIKDLPHDILAEKSLVGCLIIDGAVFDDVSDLRLQKEHFFHPQYGIIYEAIKDLSLAHKPIDRVTVLSKLKEQGKLEEVGGESSLFDIVEDQASVANVYHYGKIVRDKAAMREIIRTAMKVADMGLSYTGETQEFVQEVESAFFKLTNDAKTGGLIKLNQALRTNLKELEDTTRGRGEIGGLPTGYPRLDETLMGMQSGQLIILAARPAMGKTSFALNLALNSCRTTGLPVLIFSLEMQASELSMKLLSAQSKVDSKRLKRKDFLDTDLRSISKAVQELSSYPIFINDSGSSTILDIQSQGRKVKAEHGLGLIIIDYLQLMSSHNKALPREQQISEISRGLKILAKELECPVIALSQLNRGVESRPNKRPNTSDLRESGAIEQDADVVMFVYRDEVYYPDTKEPGIAEIIIGKNRAGETNTIKLAWVGAYTSFENLSYER